MIDLRLFKHFSGADRVFDLFLAGVLAISGFASESVRKTVEIGDDRMTIYEGAEVDPLFRHGQTILREAVRDVRERRIFSLFGPRPCGLMVRYGRWSRWTGKQLFIPAETPGYEEIKLQLFGWRPRHG